MRSSTLAAIIAALAAGPSCSGDLVGPTTGSPLPNVTSLVPSSRARGVDPSTSVVMRFSHPMGEHTELLVWLHEGTIADPLVSGRWSWSGDRTVMTFTPTSPLRPGTTYTLHLAPALQTVDGKPLDHGRCSRIGGERITDGVVFSFTTA
jgi:hypothetical protein